MPSFRQRRHLVALTLAALAALAALLTLPSLAGAEGMTIDPNGRATCQPPTRLVAPSGDAGMLIDPDGAR